MKTRPVLTDAVAESGGEGDVRVRRPSHGILWQEALGPELLGLGEVSRVAVERVGHDDGVGTFGDHETICRNVIQFSLFVSPDFTNYKFVSEGFTICTHRHPCPRTSHRIRKNSQITLHGEKKGRNLQERTEEDPSPGWTDE